MTPTGAGALLTGVACTVAGLALGSSALAALGVAALVLVLVALASVRRPAKVSIDRHVQPARVVRGTPAIAYVHLVNHGRSEAPRAVAHQRFGTGSVRLELPRLAGGEAGVRTYRLPTDRRGSFELPPLEVVRTDPFLLARSRRRHGATERLLVYPRLLPLRPLRSGHQRTLEGPDADTADEGTITFHAVRDYTTGDDLRMIHWRSTARAGRLMVRHNVDTAEPLTIVLLDLRPTGYSAATFEVAVEMAASAVVAAAAGRTPVELRATDGTRLGGPDRHDPQALVDHLAAVGPAPGGTLNEQLRLLRRQRAGTALVVVTGVLDEDDLPIAAALRRRFQRLVVVSVDPNASARPPYPGVHVLCGATGDELAGLWNLEAAR